MEGTTQPEAAEAARIAAMTSAERERAGYIEGLRKLADVLDKHPEVRLPAAGHSPYGPLLFSFDDSPEGVSAMAAARKALPCAWTKSFSGGGEHTDWLNLTGMLAGLQVQLYAPRDAVCERVVTGTRTEMVKVKDPEALAAVPEIEVPKVIEEVEWNCHPVLAGEGPVAA